MVEILSKKATYADKDFVGRRNTSYLIAGKDSVNQEEAVMKICAAFGVDEIMVGGRGGLNWSLIQPGLCDEVSTVIAQAADRTKGAHVLIDAHERYNHPLPTTFCCGKRRL